MPSRDYEEFIDAFNAHGVRYLVVGAHAVAFHARPRATRDLDLFVDPTTENAQRLLAALRDFFGGADPGYTVEDISDPRWIIQIGVAPVRIDLISQVPGISGFDAAWKKRVEGQFGAVQANYLGLDDLIAAKEASGRTQDLADVEVVRRARDRAEAAKRSRRRPGKRV